MFAFGDFVNLFAGGSCSYTVDEGAGDGGECLYFIFLPSFFLAVILNFACCQLVVTSLQLKVEGQKVHWFLFVPSFFPTVWNIFFLEAEILGLCMTTNETFTHYISAIFFFGYGCFLTWLDHLSDELGLLPLPPTSSTQDSHFWKSVFSFSYQCIYLWQVEPVERERKGEVYWVWLGVLRRKCNQ